VSRVLPLKLVVAELHVQKAGCRHGDIVWDNNPTERCVQVAGPGETAATMAQPEEVPTREIAIRRIYRHTRGMFIEPEVLMVIVW